MTPREALQRFAGPIGSLFGPAGAALGALASTAASSPLGKKDAATGEVLAKGWATSKAMQGGIGLVAIPPLIFPLVDDALPAGWPASLTKLVLMVAAFAWLTYGRKTASVPLGKAPE